MYTDIRWQQRFQNFEKAYFLLKESIEAKVIRQSLQQGYITDSLWLKALDDRNKTSHAYDENMANEVIKEITERYFFLLRDLYFTLKKEIVDE